MEKLIISATQTTPEIHLSVEEDIFRISGISRPEDVRAIYYPVTGWIKELADQIINKIITKYSKENPLTFQVDLTYFNSSSAKFLFDIFIELKRLILADVPVEVLWFYENDDPDLKEAGNDIASMTDMQFIYIPKVPE
jgi:hypothetical protein